MDANASSLLQQNLDQAAAATSGPVNDLLTCQWVGCQNAHHASAEALYEHVCETHIGRKSTNNLNLQCFWGSCRTTTVKRDHITSHIRVHVPLKPHKCDFCGKSFKRPQDLKKHVKTHADESVLFNSPQTGANNSRGGPPNGYQAPGSGKRKYPRHLYSPSTRLTSLTSDDGSYHDPSNPHLNYPYGAPQNGYNSNVGGPNFAPLYGYGGGPQTAGYGGVGLTESRKRTHDALNDFFGQAKRRQIDPGQYQDLGAQFSQFLQMFAPMAAGAGWQGGYNPGFGNGYDNNGGGMAYQTQHAPPMGAYAAPFPELRTKNDLMSIDQFLAQLQTTVYDSADHATAGYQPVQADTFAVPRRSSGSPKFQSAQSAATPGSYSSNSFAHSSNMEETPVLTPSSFQTSQSPQSTNRNLSPNSRPSGSSLYPTLPSFNTLDNSSSNQFGVGPTSVPPSGLGPQYEDFDGRRRYSGAHLQRARQSPVAETDNKEATAAERSAEKDKSLVEVLKQALETSPDNRNIKLPGVSEITQVGEGELKEDDSTEVVDPKKQAFETNLRVISALREYLAERLKKADFDGDEHQSEDGNRTPRATQDHDVEMKDEDEASEAQATTPKREGASLYPTLRPVEA